MVKLTVSPRLYWALAPDNPKKKRKAEAQNIFKIFQEAGLISGTTVEAIGFQLLRTDTFFPKTNFGPGARI
jgi:hypothetical protein